MSFYFIRDNHSITYESARPFDPLTRKPEVMKTELYRNLKKESEKFNEDMDCGVIAMAVATGESYGDCHAALELAGREHRRGTYGYMYEEAAYLLGYDTREYYRDAYGDGAGSEWVHKCKTPITIPANIPMGGFIVRVRRHALGVRDKVVHDWMGKRRYRTVSFIKVTKRKV